MKLFQICIRYLIVTTLLTGIAYPLAMTGLAKAFFPERANGSLVKRGDEILGSELLAQKFVTPKYFWPRPSGIDFNPQPSGATNWGPTSADLKAKVEERRKALLDSTSQAEGGGQVPQDLLFASASGLDPELSPAAVFFQLPRVINARKLSDQERQVVEALIKERIQAPLWGILGESRINVLELNLAMDKKFPENK
jgi:potassium-transporting ATPase KdpC subunit